MIHQNFSRQNLSLREIVVMACLSLTLLLGSGVATAECERTGSGGEVIGTLLGAAIGGLIGSQIGSGSGNKVAIGAGVLAGGLLGNKVGRSMDCRDIEYHNSTAQGSFETQ